MAAPPLDSLIAALVAAILGVFAPATEFVVTAMKPAAGTACSQAGPAAWEAQAQQLADQLSGSGSADAQSLRQQLRSAGVTPSARSLTAPTTSVGSSTSGDGGSDWHELAARLSGELANSDDPEARKLAQAIGDTGTSSKGSSSTGGPSTGGPSTGSPSTGGPSAGGPSAGGRSTDSPSTGGRNTTARNPTGPSATARSTTAPITAGPSASGPGAARPMPGDNGTGDASAGGADPTTATSRPSRSTVPSPSRAPARPGTGPCPTPSGRGAPSTTTPSTAASSTAAPFTGAGRTSTSVRPTAAPTPSNKQANERWEQLAEQLSAALVGSTDQRAMILQDALDRAGYSPAESTTTPGRATGSAARTTPLPVPGDPADGG